MKTNHNSVISLAKYIVNQLSKDNIIEININSRQQVMSDFENLICQYVKSDEDLDKGLHGLIPPSSTLSFGEMETIASQYQRDSLRDQKHRGLYYLISIRQLANEIKGYLWNSKGIEEIYVDDDQLIQNIVGVTRNFDPNNQGI